MKAPFVRVCHEWQTYFFILKGGAIVAKAKKKVRNGKVNVGLWIGEDTYNKIQEIIDADGELDFSTVVRVALKEYIAKHSKK